MGKGGTDFCAFPVFPVVFYKKRVLNNFEKFAEPVFARAFFFIKVASLTLLRKTPAQTVF